MTRYVRILAILCAACTVAEGNSGIYQPLPVPKAEDVVLFSNGLAPSTGERIYKKRADILEFLRRGKNNLNVSSWYAIERARWPKTVQVCDGVFTDKRGRIYFWEMLGTDVLKLRTAEHESAVIELRRK